jgi:hypothetical protein
VASRPAHPLWLWINLLCLDAPLVAVIWQDFLARCYPNTVLPAGRVTLGLTVWAIYLADRLADARRSSESSPRHDFSRRHFRLVTILFICAIVADVVVAVLFLRASVFRNGLIAAGAMAVYLALFAILRIGGFFKTVTAAALFTIGVFLVAWSTSAVPPLALDAAALSFCALCIGNLTLLDTWDRGEAGTRLAIPLFVVTAICFAAGHLRWYEATGASAAALGLLALCGARIAQPLRRMLADAVLLTPVLFLFLPR